MKVNISPGNSKMGRVPSVSLPAVITCRRDCSCCEKCYARKLEKLRKTVREAYARNLEILRNDPGKYWREVKAAVMMSRFFRFHVSGDIPDYEYFCKMVETAIENPHCEILCFTKQYGIVNRWIDEHGKTAESLPKNLHMIFSGWRGLKMENPYNLPEAHVRFKDGYCDAREDAIECFGNCTECSIAGCGCWKLKNGEQVVFGQH